MVDEKQAAEFANRRAELLVQMSEALRALSVETRNLRADVGQIKRTSLIDRAIIGVLLVVAMVSVYGSLSNRTVLDKINCATDPSGQCSVAKKEAASSSAFMGTLEAYNLRVSVAAVTCALQDYARPGDIATCVNQALAAAPVPAGR
jgi:hypothetical protein